MNEYLKYDANEIPFNLLLLLDPGTDIGVGSCLPIIHTYCILLSMLY